MNIENRECALAPHPTPRTDSRITPNTVAASLPRRLPLLESVLPRPSPPGEAEPAAIVPSFMVSGIKAHQGYGWPRTTRKPMPWLRKPGGLELRAADLASPPGKRQLPPRITRVVPEEAPGGLVTAPPA